VLGQPNDYFEASLAVPVALNDARAAHDGAALADSTFAQIAAAYSR
jgi:hypothetical protein